MIINFGNLTFFQRVRVAWAALCGRQIGIGGTIRYPHGYTPPPQGPLQ